MEKHALTLLGLTALILAAERKLQERGGRFESSDWFLVCSQNPEMVPITSIGVWHLVRPDDSGMPEPRGGVRIDHLLNPPRAAFESPLRVVQDREGKKVTIRLRPFVDVVGAVLT